MSKAAVGSSAIRNVRWNVEFILKDFYRNYPQFFAAGRVELCSKLYYPIALLELEVLESAGEEFDTIEHSILSLIYAGLTDPEQICDVLGLPLNYTMLIIKVLQGYGHVTDSGITELGIKSAIENVKYTRMRVRHKVQADTWTGLLLRKEMLQRVQFLSSSEETNIKIPHLTAQAYLSDETLLQINEVIAKYKHSEQSVFHANVEGVEEIIDKEIKYTDALLLKFTHLPHPFVLLQCRSGSSKTRGPQYEWKPVAISQSNAGILMKAIEGIHVVEDECFESFIQLAEDIQSAIEHSLGNEYDFRRLRAKIEKGFGGMVDADKVTFGNTVMSVDLENLKLMKLNREIFSVLESVALSENHVPFMWLSREDEFPGMVCYVETRHEELRYFSKQLAELWLRLPRGSDIYNGLISQLDFQATRELSVQQLQLALHAVATSYDSKMQNEV
ncbi:hypothetical protein [Paenibacillus ginsengarvi]|uniref:Uncharacterized protein n=1 Tax=Paenibacillus ginsengarvi TaxID=400777 RepID=A0A3B0BUI9_9BACL|nr:hypothetical protein [Paenibacillus ginsengarvi]RKN77075.1 hypothetical protein D7M11_23920 [Paenibacillus ginsengarvi]